MRPEPDFRMRTMPPHDQSRLHWGYLHEVRVHPDGLHSCQALGPAGDAARRMVGESTCVWVFWARCHLDAMKVYYDFTDGGTYKSDEPCDREDHPSAWYVEQEAYLAIICRPRSKTAE
jgi:hypothetical protein